ncbi:MAG: hypothetical protein WAV47_19600 [Blastocatellia bacterium]
MYTTEEKPKQQKNGCCSKVFGTRLSIFFSQFFEGEADALSGLAVIECLNILEDGGALYVVGLNKLWVGAWWETM